MQGLIWFFKIFGKGIKSTFLFLLNKRLLPISLIGVFLFTNFIQKAKEIGFDGAIVDLFQSILAAEHTIYTNVTLAIENSPKYNLFAVYSIIMSAYILWRLFRFLRNALTESQGANKNWFSIGWALVIIFLAEAAVMTVTQVTTVYNEGFVYEGFIPIYNGIIYLLANIQPVISNIHIL